MNYLSPGDTWLPLINFNIECKLTPSKGHRDSDAHELFINGQQFKFPGGATAGYTQGEVLIGFLKSLGAKVKETNG